MTRTPAPPSADPPSSPALPEAERVRRRDRITAHTRRSLAALADSLRLAYRVTARILGRPRFQAAALAFARRHPPADPVPAAFGDRFPDFLAEQQPLPGLPYLADVAALDRLWTEAHLAPHADALALDDLAVDGNGEWRTRRLTLHPAAGFLWFTSPAVSLWQAHQDGIDAVLPEAQAEGALVTRPKHRVALRSISRPEHRMLFGLRLGERIDEAAAATAKVYPEADPDEVLAELVGSGAFMRP